MVHLTLHQTFYCIISDIQVNWLVLNGIDELPLEFDHPAIPALRQIFPMSIQRGHVALPIQHRCGHGRRRCGRTMCDVSALHKPPKRYPSARRRSTNNCQIDRQKVMKKKKPKQNMQMIRSVPLPNYLWIGMSLGDVIVQFDMFVCGQLHGLRLPWLLSYGMAQYRAKAILIGNIFHRTNLLAGINIGVGAAHGASAIANLTMCTVGVAGKTASRITKDVWMWWRLRSGGFSIAKAMLLMDDVRYIANHQCRARDNCLRMITW